MSHIISIRTYPEWVSRAADYFSSKWNIDRQLYLDSMNDSLSTEKSVPRWYLMLRDDEIIGGYGLISNDFMVRTDLYPWFCALYIETAERGQQLGAKLLSHGRLEAAKLGFNKVYLNTDHVGYYEKYGWSYIGDYAHQSGENTRVYEVSTMLIETSRLMLRPLTEDDLAVVRLINGDEHKTDEAAIEFIRWQSNPGRLLTLFYLWLKQTNRCIGRVYIHAKPEINNEVEIGYSILEQYRNQGYATEAAKAIIWYAFEQAGQEVLSAIIKPENTASRRVIEKLGFISGGVRTVLDNDGKYTNFDYFRLYHTDYLPNPEWDVHNLYKPEPMSEFFDLRADGYNNVMFKSSSNEEDYKKLGSYFSKTNEAIQILDVGCGTGIELDYIWKRMPNSHITCVDVSRAMLNLLLKNHHNNHEHITIIEASYIDWSYPEKAFDIVVSNMTMHHLWPDEKVEVYRKILSTLNKGGIYIEGDFIVKDNLMVEQYRQRYEIITASLTDKAKAGEYHIDIPCTIEIQKKLLQEAGFRSVEVLDDSINCGNGAILKARK